MKYTYQFATDYRGELRQLRRQRDKLIRDKALIKELLNNANGIELELELSKIEADIKIVGGMISSTEYALFWIESGFEQGAYEKRPITNANKQVRTQLWGEVENAPFLQQEESGDPLSEEEQALLEEVLNTLPEIERSVYISIYGKGNTQEQTAEFIGIPCGSVDYRLKRAQSLIDHQLLYGKQIALL